MKNQHPAQRHGARPQSQGAAARRAGDDLSAPCPPPAHLREELKVPYLKLRGRWLRQMGFNVGRQLQIEACDGVITIRLLGRPPVEDLRTPRATERTIVHGEVQSDMGEYVPEDVIR